MSNSDAISNDENGLNKTVCALCRQRKTKCDRKLPKCGFCVKAKIACQYVGQPRKRGLRAGYVTELESRIDSLETQVESLRHTSRSSMPMAAIGLQNTPLSIQNDPSRSTGSTPIVPGHHQIFAETNAAVVDLMSFPHTYFFTLADIWFKEDHHWLPILEYTHIQKCLASLPQPVDHIPDVVLGAMLALKISYSSQAISLGYKGRRRLSMHLRSQVLAEAMATPSLDSIRAMFIIAIFDYGSDNIPSTFNIMSMCRRTGEHIGILRQLLQRIESQPPQQVGPPSREAFTSESSQIAQTWAVLSFDAVSSLGVSWRDVTAALVEHLSGVAYVSAPDFRDSFVTHVHLAAIGIQPVHEFFFNYGKGQHQTLEGDTLTATDDMYQNLMSYIYGLPSSDYTILADGAVDFDINQIFTRVLSNAAVIMVYGRYTSQNDAPNFELARDRCMESYKQLIGMVRNISDADIEVNSPTFGHFLTQGARFKLHMQRQHGQSRDAGFDVLMHGINMGGRRWPINRRLEIVLRAALTELDTNVSSGLPAEFWDLRRSMYDISEDLKRWVNTFKHSLWIGSLNGPYA